MSSRNLFASILMACLLTVVLGGLAPEAKAASAGQSFLKPGESARNNVIEIQHRRRGPWPNLPIAPSYQAYDWPYYFSRGHYPTHIGPGYVYYGYPILQKQLLSEIRRPMLLLAREVLAPSLDGRPQMRRQLVRPLRR